MSSRSSFKTVAYYYAKWVGISAFVGGAAGVASAIFLASLAFATTFREGHPWLLYLLPIGGLIVGWLYLTYGRSIEGGNNLIIEEFHNPRSVIPFRMTPLIYLATVITHLIGGSAGREGTAVQMGGSIADQFTHLLKPDHQQRRILLMAGMSGGFASVFGVPFAGLVFGLEVLTIGKFHLRALIECAVSAFVAHAVTLSLGIHHTNYVHPIAPGVSIQIGLACLGGGIVFGLTARLYSLLSHGTSKAAKHFFPSPPLRSFVGGAVLSGVFVLVPALTRYAGLGIDIITEAFRTPMLPLDWLGKLIMTCFTLGVGFKGGEVTPLLFIGATLGNTLSAILPLPLPAFAALGFVGVFAGAANTPVACTVMAIELFGTGIAPYAALVCLVSYFVSGHQGIYHSQKIHIRKSHYLHRGHRWLKTILRKH